MPSFRSAPLRVYFLGGLFLLLGFAAVLTTVRQFQEGTVNINLAILLIPIGVGLLLGWRSCLAWAKFVIGCGWALLAVASILAVLKPEAAVARWGGQVYRGSEALPSVLGITLALATGLYGLWWLLQSPPTQRYFNDCTEKPAQVS